MTRASLWHPGAKPVPPSLASAREEYDWDWSWPPGCATLSKLPRHEDYRPEFLARVLQLTADIVRNHAAMGVQGVKPTGPLPRTIEDLRSDLLSAAEAFYESGPPQRPATPDGYAAFFATIAAPPLVVRERAHPEQLDALFAWQRIAGANPMSIARWTKLPDDFTLSEPRYQAAAGGGSLAAALAEGRAFGVDFTALHGTATTRLLGRQKYLCGTRGLFVAQDRKLRPVAIQLEPGGTVFTPADGAAWASARYCLQVADANVHETMEHLGKTHMVMEAVGIAAHRQLLDDHPLRKMLDPHLVGTFAVNHSAKTSLIAPKGVIDKVFAPRIDLAAGFVRSAVESIVLQDRAPARELKARGVDDPAVLEYPYRDDVLPVYAAIERFVRAYLALYFPDDASVAADTGLQEWVAEVGSNIGGALKGIRPVQTVAGLVEWMANILFISSAQHAAVNFPQFPFFSWGASVAGACWAPPPTGTAVTDADLLSLMPPWDCLFMQADTVYELAGVQFTRLGDYSYPDPRTIPIVHAFQRELAAIDQAIAEADESRLLTYPYLRPGQIPASINI